MQMTGNLATDAEALRAARKAYHKARTGTYECKECEVKYLMFFKAFSARFGCEAAILAVRQRATA